MNYEQLQVQSEAAPGVTLIRLNRPAELNALSRRLMEELSQACHELDANPAVRCVVITGDDRAFAAGADIKEMAGNTLVDMLAMDQFARWGMIRRFRKPLIGAVSGFCLGGGCELAMTCDMLIASETAQFGQPEINLGMMPGAGGTQRLTKAVGKAKAMEMVLTGRPIKAQEALALGLVNRVLPVELYLEEALKLAAEVATKAPIAVKLAKEAVNRSFELPLEQGMDKERDNFYMLFATEDRKEGLQAFVEKRKPNWKAL